MSASASNASDLSVLLIFFARPDTFEKVFEKVRAAKPKQLFLACDGPREGRPEDIEKTAACKKIAENIDWDCEVHRRYSEVNLGCGEGPQQAITWAFSHTESLVVLEDDCVPHDSFFPYMSEMLAHYRDDTRIGVISGFNHFADWDCGDYSCFYAKMGPLAGAWGSWKRVWQGYDYALQSVNDPLIQRLLQGEITFSRAKKGKLKVWQKTAARVENGEKLSYWDHQFLYLKYMQSYLAVVPRFSLVSNIGLGDGATHSVSTGNPMPTIFFAPERHLEFPLKYPPFVLCDRAYDNTVDAKYAYPHPVKRFYGRVKRVLRRILFRK